MQLNPDKECIKKGIFDIFFKQLSVCSELNKIAVDFCIYQQNTKEIPWFMIEANKNDEAIAEFVSRVSSYGFCVTETEKINWERKIFRRFLVTVPDENILNIVKYYYEHGYKNHKYYDIEKKMSVEPWG